ncbi:hypothetical protein CLBEI_50820 [Clostridium beijerinckii]|nr:hypothetical protein CLBEI_50820 [Clostridium beijerinckii]
MVSNLGKTLEKMERKATEKGIEKGIEKKAKETAIKAIEMGMNNEVITELTGLSNEDIDFIRKGQSH